jgi:hypothetical protein
VALVSEGVGAGNPGPRRCAGDAAVPQAAQPSRRPSRPAVQSPAGWPVQSHTLHRGLPRGYPCRSRSRATQPPITADGSGGPCVSWPLHPTTTTAARSRSLISRCVVPPALSGSRPARWRPPSATALAATRGKAYWAFAPPWREHFWRHSWRFSWPLWRRPARRRWSAPAPAPPPRGGGSHEAAAPAAGRCRRCGSPTGPWRACGSFTYPRRARGAAAPRRLGQLAGRRAVRPPPPPLRAVLPQLLFAPLPATPAPKTSFIAALRNQLYDRGLCRCGQRQRTQQNKPMPPGRLPRAARRAARVVEARAIAGGGSKRVAAEGQGGLSAQVRSSQHDRPSAFPANCSARPPEMPPPLCPPRYPDTTCDGMAGEPDTNACLTGATSRAMRLARGGLPTAPAAPAAPRHGAIPAPPTCLLAARGAPAPALARDQPPAPQSHPPHAHIPTQLRAKATPTINNVSTPARPPLAKRAPQAAAAGTSAPVTVRRRGTPCRSTLTADATAGCWPANGGSTTRPMTPASRRAPHFLCPAERQIAPLASMPHRTPPRFSLTPARASPPFQALQALAPLKIVTPHPAPEPAWAGAQPWLRLRHHAAGAGGPHGVDSQMVGWVPRG